jgi:hypothetical protein
MKEQNVKSKKEVFVSIYLNEDMNFGALFRVLDFIFSWK